MFLLQKSHYIDLATMLYEAIDNKCYYSGRVYFETDDADFEFIASLIIVYHDVDYPEGTNTEISDITSVWWELHTTTLDGEQINDLDFETLKQHILSCP